MMKTKRLLAFLLFLALLLPGTSMAEGLRGLGGGLPDIHAPQRGEAGVLPDPAELLGREGTLYAENYDFAPNFCCAVYTYPLPGDTFLDAYLAQVQANGFLVSAVQIESFPAFRLEYDNLAALLLPDYTGVMMLMVQNGLVFGQPLPEYYLSMVYNGRKVLTDELDFMRKYDAYQYKFSYFDPEQTPASFELRFPVSMRPGDEYTWTQDSPPDYLYFYNGEILLNYQSFTRRGDWGGKDDYFRLKIVAKEETARGLLLEGRFSCMLDYGEIVIENGAFRILVR